MLQTNAWKNRDLGLFRQVLYTKVDLTDERSDEQLVLVEITPRETDWPGRCEICLLDAVHQKYTRQTVK